MSTIRALNGEENIGSISFSRGLVVLRLGDYPNDTVGLETENDKVLLDLFLVDLAGAFTNLQLQPNETLAVLFDVTLKTATKLRDPLDLKGNLGAETLRMTASQFLQDFGVKDTRQVAGM